MTARSTSIRRKNFAPFHFQAPLAAGGITLMAFNWLQFAVPHPAGPLSIADIAWPELSLAQLGAYGLLVAVMMVLTALNLLLTVVLLADLARWVVAADGFRAFLGGPPARVTGVFVPIASLAMTMAVVFAAGPFFVPGMSAIVPASILPAALVFAALWLAAVGLEVRLLAGLRRQPLDRSGLNFVWLLDVFAFGLVALAGSGLATMAEDRGVAIAVGLGVISLAAAGTVLLVGKLAVLLRAQAASGTLAPHQLQPAYFLLVPITCLYGVSYYRAMLFAQKWFGLTVENAMQVLLAVAYALAVAWALFTLYLLVSYFRDYFRRSEYFPTQWAMV